MGRVKNVTIKNLGDDLIAQNEGRFTDDFDTNKKVLGEVQKIKSTKVRNVIAGYITRKIKIAKRKGL